MNGGDFDSMVGEYRWTVKECIHAAAFLLLQILIVTWFYFNDGQIGISLGEGAIAGAVVVSGCCFIVSNVLRIVVVERHYLLSRSLFGLFSKRIDLTRVESIRFGWFSQGLAVEFVVDGKRVRIAGNERFLKALRAMARRLDEAEPRASGR
jgi:hypothetical protein